MKWKAQDTRPAWIRQNGEFSKFKKCPNNIFERETDSLFFQRLIFVRKLSIERFSVYFSVYSEVVNHQVCDILKKIFGERLSLSEATASTCIRSIVKEKNDINELVVTSVDEIDDRKLELMRCHLEKMPRNQAEMLKRLCDDPEIFVYRGSGAIPCLIYALFLANTLNLEFKKLNFNRLAAMAKNSSPHDFQRIQKFLDFDVSEILDTVR